MGVIDLRQWDFERDGSIYLEGEWAFFWGELLQPDQILDLNQAPFVSVPGVWSNYEIEGLTFTPEGYATYTLTIYPPDTPQVFGLYNEGQGIAYSLWVDGHLLGQNGQVGTNPQSMTVEKNQIPFSSSLMEKRWILSCKYRTSITVRVVFGTAF